jgi:4-azaleucine resistance transporter AzlC
MKDILNKSGFWVGVKSGIPIAVGYIPISIAFGLLAKISGIPDTITMLMSFLIYAGASQFIAINLLMLNVPYTEIVIATFILNLRHFLMSATISQRIEKNVSLVWRFLLAFGITDETFAMTSLQKNTLISKYFILGLNIISFLSWNIGTCIGVFFALVLPNVLKVSMGIALYAMFIGLIIPSMKKSRAIFSIVCMAGGTNFCISILNVDSYYLNGLGIIFSTILSAGIGTILFSEKEECENLKRGEI